MLPRYYRLKREDFNLLSTFKKNVFSSPHFSLKLYRAGFVPSRLAVIISSSIVRKAVERNKLRRRIKGFILEYSEGVKSGLAILVYVKKDMADMSFQQIKKELVSLFKEAGILKNDQ
jgi:ribonuclease P protein component